MVLRINYDYWEWSFVATRMVIEFKGPPWIAFVAAA